MYARDLADEYPILDRGSPHLTTAQTAIPRQRIATLLTAAARPLRPDGRFAESWSTGTTIWWLAVAFGAVLLAALLL
ncbi:hypothetical protein [Nocardia mexicana]|uniref:Uncharacterized protein n=1 Tax=Nocardia mexicana TaxID=279262 RepID=A0A370GMC1_9NOCA|nr:hypothetical protein [Nocardia mexicana]RDI44426.1 hypothetical protein DFR68_11743 [Nocardia mexicana]